jgi:ATP-binding cassette subfamily F protein uup
LTLRRALAPEGDSVVYQDRVIHVASWAARFLFSSEQLDQPVERLSGGERARVLIAQLMLQSADILLLDEPTNDLDIPTLEILEQSMLEFRGSLVLVTHDRYLLDRVSTVVLGLDGQGGAESFADYGQWEIWQAERRRAQDDTMTSSPPAPGFSAPPAQTQTKLSYLEAREYAGIEQRIAEAEQRLQSKRAALEDPAIASDGPRLVTAQAEMDAAQKDVDTLYARWAELQEKAERLSSR